LPILLQVCPTCNSGIKQTRGFQWIDAKPLLSGACTSSRPCPAADPTTLGDRVGLLWIGAKFYPTPTDFMAEAGTMGVSRRIVAVPRGFKLGETWVFFAHPRVKEIVDPTTGKGEWIGGVFHIFRPTRIEKIVTETQANDEAAMTKLAEAGITAVIVPDDDRDHQGTVYDKDITETQHEMFATQ
jgi:hypothetical protein